VHTDAVYLGNGAPCARSSRKAVFEMVDVLDKLEQLAKEQNSIQWTAEAQASEPEQLLFVASRSCGFARLLQIIWSVMQVRFRAGGVPGKRLLQECDLLIQLSTDVGQRLALINKDWPARALPSDVAQSIYNDLQAARRLLDSLVREVNKVREWAATPPQVSADPEELKRRIKQADKDGNWVKLSDVVSRMRQGASPKQE